MNGDPVATYRVQLTPEFGFDEAGAVLPYLSRLGVSHLYTSPCLQAVAGSRSGYDVVNPARVNEELGGESGYQRLARCLEERGLCHMLDIVPNHMAIVGNDNPWWWDVLENGPASFYAPYFDVDWDVSGEGHRDRVLLPVLGDHFGRVLEGGELKVSFADGRFTLRYHEHAFPAEPSSLAVLLTKVAERVGDPELGFLADSYAALPRPRASFGPEVERRHRNRLVLNSLLERRVKAKPEIGEAIAGELEQMNADPERLGQFIEDQNYRLAFWRAADHDLGYRRFFNINDLVGLRVERPEVFHAVHALPLQWVREGLAHALRVDHPDGLLDPGEYMERLRRAAPRAWIVIEKILGWGERLPASWPVDGTTGYDFLNRIDGIFADPEGESALTAFYGAFTGETESFEEVARRSKAEVLEKLLGSEVKRLTLLLREICEEHWRYRDYTADVLRRAIVALATAFPVYRSYLRANGEALSEQDRQAIGQALAEAESREELDPELWRFLGEILRLEQSGEREVAFALRFQQLTGPAMAKGMEDTAFYRYNRLIALNEVGGDPGRFGVSLSEFHAACREAAEQHPRSMLATSTHDTKRSEDVRARLVVLSEMPEDWQAACERWRKLSSAYQPEGLDRNVEYLIYQTLVGAWPIDRERLRNFLVKAMREAKTSTTWTEPNADYENGLVSFAEALLEDQVLVRDLERFVAQIREPGWVNSLSQTLVKMMAPGVPDIYQGCELWDHSLVDPDNRRPIDFALRMRLLDELETLDLSAIMERMEEGLPKLWVIRQAIAVRREEGERSLQGSAYEALGAEGERADHVLAFRRWERVIVVVPRFSVRLKGDWRDCRIPLPAGVWSNRLVPGECWSGAAALGALLSAFPVALLVKES